MSSAGFSVLHDPAFYHWSPALNAAAYMCACYEITATCDGMAAALAMAMEQSVGATRIHAYIPDQGALAASCIRVCRVRPLAETDGGVVAPYRLHTPVYDQPYQAAGSFAIELAVPLSLLANKPGQLGNILVGELPRLGFLTRFRLVGATLPTTFGPGPGFGAAGIRALAGQAVGPLLCRSMRPAVGLDPATMAHLNRDVLAGGFHIVKDDELQVFADFPLFTQHIQAMIAARDAARCQSNEKKLYFANLICEPWELSERWELCCRLGVDGVLMAPWIQGLGTLCHLARQRRLPILAHNTLGELFTRHPDWKIDDAVVMHWLRVLGADMFVTSGDFGNAPAAASSDQLGPARAPYGDHPAMLPILQGGKNPAGLPCYRQAVGSDDFMLIVASWVDQHPAGLLAGAAAFREAADAFRA